MKTVLLAGLGAVAIVSLTAFARVVPATHRTHPFTAGLSGDATADFFGEATFARVEGGDRGANRLYAGSRSGERRWGHPLHPRERQSPERQSPEPGDLHDLRSG
jgi:hypothetical protein